MTGLCCHLLQPVRKVTAVKLRQVFSGHSMVKVVKFGMVNFQHIAGYNDMVKAIKLSWVFAGHTIFKAVKLCQYLLNIPYSKLSNSVSICWTYHIQSCQTLSVFAEHTTVKAVKPCQSFAEHTKVKAVKLSVFAEHTIFKAVKLSVICWSYHIQSCQTLSVIC